LLETKEEIGDETERKREKKGRGEKKNVVNENDLSPNRSSLTLTHKSGE